MSELDEKGLETKRILIGDTFREGWHIFNLQASLVKTTEGKIRIESIQN